MKNESSYAIIVGCGRLGSFLAGSLSEHGYSVVVIDRDADRFAELPVSFSGFTIEGNAGEFATLERAKVATSQIFAAVTGSDSVNLMTSQIARALYQVPRVASRIYDRELEEFCRHLDIIPVPAVTIEAASFLEILSGDGGSR